MQDSPIRTALHGWGGRYLATKDSGACVFSHEILHPPEEKDLPVGRTKDTCILWWGCESAIRHRLLDRSCTYS
ncbi:Hypothetical protein NTJ_14167 [Nesidiocoris tenuis]|uniref:Uncharacterized protein n=1 Tax=Nesidiocoris tenuis TaxID=355587 RepID=A0ABN7BAE7_9HEMI|nr:Hypothetical protein NTJ_14167 [Nesidiocoris tenuis]